MGLGVAAGGVARSSPRRELGQAGQGPPPGDHQRQRLGSHVVLGRRAGEAHPLPLLPPQVRARRTCRGPPGCCPPRGSQAAPRPSQGGCPAPRTCCFGHILHDPHPPPTPPPRAAVPPQPAPRTLCHVPAEGRALPSAGASHGDEAIACRCPPSPCCPGARSCGRGLQAGPAGGWGGTPTCRAICRLLCFPSPGGTRRTAGSPSWWMPGSSRPPLSCSQPSALPRYARLRAPLPRTCRGGPAREPALPPSRGPAEPPLCRRRGATPPAGSSSPAVPMAFMALAGLTRKHHGADLPRRLSAAAASQCPELENPRLLLLPPAKASPGSWLPVGRAALKQQPPRSQSCC